MSLENRHACGNGAKSNSGGFHVKISFLRGEYVESQCYNYASDSKGERMLAQDMRVILYGTDSIVSADDTQ